MLKVRILIRTPRHDLIITVAHEHSYEATWSNNRTENEAVKFLLSKNPRLRLPNKIERKAILNILGLDKSFSKAYDLVMVPAAEVGDLLSVPAKQLILVELKTTKKKLVNSPNGFFFGATENEFRLAKILGDKYQFCFVCLHPESQGYVLLTAEELEKKIKTRRIQYQINL